MTNLQLTIKVEMDPLTRKCTFRIDTNMEKFEAIYCLLNVSMKILTTESKKVSALYKFDPRNINEEISKR